MRSREESKILWIFGLSNCQIIWWDEQRDLESQVRLNFKSRLWANVNKILGKSLNLSEHQFLNQWESDNDIIPHSQVYQGFPSGWVVKNPPAMQETQEIRLIPGSGRSLEEGNGNTLQYFCLENPMVRGAWQATAQGSQRVGYN